MVALIDCNNFYVSCEQVFRPGLQGKPVVVLSNNDGCVISRSEEAKALGIRMTDPWYKIEKKMEQLDVTWFSSNYALYADMSSRVMNNLSRYSICTEVYSIDECFLDLSGVADLDVYARHIHENVIRATGIPISIGIAPSKTLAKLANRMGKKKSGICILRTEDQISEALGSFPLSSVWGIGRAYARKLSAYGIETALQLRQRPLNWVQKHMTIHGVRMWHELWGKSCLPVSDLVERKQGVCTSRSFGRLTGNITDLEEATASYTSRLAEKLRRNKSCATVFSLRLVTNRHRSDLPQMHNGITICLPHPCNNTPELVKHALECLKLVYKPGFKFLKVEVFAFGLISEEEVQLNLFSEYKSKKNNRVSTLISSINQHYGTGTVRVAAEGFNNAWSMRRNYLSPAYTSNWDDIIRVK